MRSSIAGSLHLDRRPAAPAPGVADVERMTEALAHRGPQGHGSWEAHGVALGHRRLRILDLSDSGAQPMTRDYLTITYNGELYNFAELRDRLRGDYPFTSGTDTEVVLRAWQKWGTAALEDYLSMQTGVEARVPFLVHRIVEWCFDQPFDVHAPTREGKVLLRRAMNRRLPDELLHRPKQAFPYPHRSVVQHSRYRLVDAHEPDVRADPLVSSAFGLPRDRCLSTLPLGTLWLLLALWRWHDKRQRTVPPRPASKDRRVALARQTDRTSGLPTWWRMGPPVL